MVLLDGQWLAVVFDDEKKGENLEKKYQIKY